MRVLLLGPVPPPHGGVQANMSAIAERLRFFKHECRLIAITKSDEIDDSTDVFHPRSIWQLLRLLVGLRADLVHLHFGGDFTVRLAALAFLCGLLPGKKSVLTFHSGGFANSSAGKAAKKMSLRGFAVRRLDKIVVVNDEMRVLFEKYGVKSKKIRLVAPFVLRQPDASVCLPENLKSFAEQHSPLLFTASWLEPHYDLPLQIRVLNELKTDFPDIGLLIAGSGYQEAELKKLIAATDHADSVLLAGDVKHEFVLHLISRADVVLRTTHFDGDAISVREALFLGTPVVATDNKMRPENVNLIRVGDRADLRRAVREALTQGKSNVAEIADGWKNIDAVLQIYCELLKLAENPQNGSSLFSRKTAK